MIITYGCIPNSETPRVMAEINASAVPWDGDITKTPNVIEWASFEAALNSMPDIQKNWWEVYDWKQYMTASQEYRPNCAGFGMANAAMMRTLIQAGIQHSEQLPQKFNPMLTWLLSKGGSAWGGQSIGAMAKYGNEVGNYLACDIGDYDPARASTRRGNEADENARKHQICYSIYDGDSPAEAIVAACRKGFTVFVGNSRGIASGVTTDSNGVEVVRTAGSWSHATAFGGFKIVNGKRYVFWVNSHGSIYQSGDGTPPIGGWMSEESVEYFMGGSFADVCVIVYAECPYDLSIKPSLNPEVA